MKDFKHPYLNKVYPRWKAHPKGGVYIDAWFVVPNVVINPADGFFDQSLGDAAVMHAKSKGLTCDIYVVAS